MDAHQEVGLCGPKLIDGEGCCQLSCRLFPTVGDKIARRLPLAVIRARRRAVEMADWDHAAIREVDYVIGACQVIRRAALSQVGFLDEHIFYGPEDVDLCLRLQKADWRIVYNPEAVVIHQERRVTRVFFSFLTYQHLRGLLYYFGSMDIGFLAVGSTSNCPHGPQRSIQSRCIRLALLHTSRKRRFCRKSTSDV
jgi:GT2 family glycosyltransferase